MLLPRTIASAVDKIAKNALGRDWNLYAVLMEHWTEIVGPDYAEATTPVKISFPKGKPDPEKWMQGHRTGGSLTVRAPQGLVMDLTYQTPRILERITAYFGYPAVEKILFEPFYGSSKVKPCASGDNLVETALPPELEKEILSIEDKGLAERLASLAKALSSKQPQ
jgi:hypothetical protein